MKCSVDSCDATSHARGWCRRHYMNWWRRGDHLADPPPRVSPNKDKPQPPAPRFWPRVEKTDGCWLWRGAMFTTGYGEFWFNGRRTLAHRMSYILTHGDLSPDLVVMHTCDTPACVNPDHLVAGTQAQNVTDMARKGRWRNQHAAGWRHPAHAEVPS